MFPIDLTDQVRGFTDEEAQQAKDVADNYANALKKAGRPFVGDYIVVPLGNIIVSDTRQLRVFLDGRVELHKP